jgi:hypothetical protein
VQAFAEKQKSASLAPAVRTGPTWAVNNHPGLRLQHTLGNRAVQRLLSAGLQRKLSVSTPGDEYEREADRVAEHVMRMPEPTLQRGCACGGGTAGGACNECAKNDESAGAMLQREARSSRDVSAALPIVQDVLNAPGRPLDLATRAFMEPRFGQAFGDVRVHTDRHAHASARAVNALAYTVGRDIVFGAGQYVPSSASGRRLLAHELSHVTQQRAGALQVRRYSTEDCGDAQRGLIRTAHNQAVTMLHKAVDRLVTSPVTSSAQRHFANHFGAYASWRRDIVVWHLRRSIELLENADIAYECESECDSDDRAYTYWIFGDIHLCPNWLADSDLNERAETLIHELHHWDPLRGHLDLGYHGNQRDVDTVWIVAVNNADSYSELVQDLYEGP